MIKSDARCTSEITSRIAIKKNNSREEEEEKKKALSPLKFKVATSKMLHLERTLVWYGNLDTSS